MLDHQSCPSLESLGPKDVLKSLSSLTDLYIEDCPKLKSLPEEGISPSLQHLVIQGCPLLMERCRNEKGGGQDWPKIMHVPDLEVESTDVCSTQICQSQAIFSSLNQPTLHCSAIDHLPNLKGRLQQDLVSNQNSKGLLPCEDNIYHINLCSSFTTTLSTALSIKLDCDNFFYGNLKYYLLFEAMASRLLIWHIAVGPPLNETRGSLTKHSSIGHVARPTLHPNYHGTDTHLPYPDVLSGLSG
ncbi:hypothetical protein CK203_112946 [Vitis vinifera]|uniref:Disease resistance protein n=1 Tax=Vitis vinifera TaxID=29760 RepID=A0A438CBM4_VITVI|nr:hypothetical protein CK203_112946 [Vitis vinifera]